MAGACSRPHTHPIRGDTLSQFKRRGDWAVAIGVRQGSAKSRVDTVDTHTIFWELWAMEARRATCRRVNADGPMPAVNCRRANAGSVVSGIVAGGIVARGSVVSGVMASGSDVK